MAGRPRKPVAAKILAGTFRPDRDGDPASQVQAAGVPEAPAHLDGEARACWDRIVPGLAASGVAAACDANALTAMCEWWALYRRLADALVAAPADRTICQLTTAAAIANDKWAAMAGRFGLTPSDRAKLKAEPKALPSAVPARKRG